MELLARLFYDDESAMAMIARSNGLALSRAAPIDRDGRSVESHFQNRSGILAASGVGSIPAIMASATPHQRNLFRGGFLRNRAASSRFGVQSCWISFPMRGRLFGVRAVKVGVSYWKENNCTPGDLAIMAGQRL